MNPLPLVRASFARNPVTAAIFILLIALATALGVAVSMQERALRQGSARAADKFDLLVAAPGSQTDLLLSTVFLRPTAVELLPGPVAARVLADPNASFAAPLAFGDSMGDSPVIGTSAAFVEHLSGGLAEGRAFAQREEAVVGALVAAKLGERLEIRHGHADDVSGGQDADSVDLDHGRDHDDHDHDHDDHGHDDHDHDHDEAHDRDHEDDHAGHAGEHHHEPVTVTGRMNPTGTPWDRAIVVPVEYVWSVHGLSDGHAEEGKIGPPWDEAYMPGLPAIVVKPESVAAAYGLRSRYRTAESTAFFPAETMVELYAALGDAAYVMSRLTLVAQILVIAAILAGLLAVLDLQRRRFAVLRALGAPASYVFLIVWIYVGVMILIGGALGLGLGWLLSSLVSGMISEATGVAMTAKFSWREFGAVGLLFGVGLVLALIPAWRIYRTPTIEALR